MTAHLVDGGIACGMSRGSLFASSRRSTSASSSILTPAIAALGLGQRKSHSTEVRSLCRVHVRGDRRCLDAFGHLSKDVVFRRHHPQARQERVDLGNRTTSRRAVGRLQAHGEMRAADYLGRCMRGTAAPTIDRLPARNVESQFRTTPCSRNVSQGCASAPRLARFRQQFQSSGAFGWGGRDRTSVWGNQNPLPYRLATPQQAGRAVAILVT